MAIPKRARVGGSAFTVFVWEGKVIAGARLVTHTSPPPVADAVPIQPLDETHPTQIITPNAVSMGTLVVELYELYGEPVWGRLSDIANSVDLQEIFEKVANLDRGINLHKAVRPPAGFNMQPYQEVYHNTVVTNVRDGESIEIGTMQVMKQIDLAYTHVTRPNRQKP